MVIQRSLLPLLSVPSLIMCLALPAESRAENKPNAQQAAAKKGKPAAVRTEEMKFEQATLLRQAFILLAAGNHDYNGHRARAMHAVKAAIQILDDSLMKHGTVQQKAAAVGKGRGRQCGRSGEANPGGA